MFFCLPGTATIAHDSKTAVKEAQLQAAEEGAGFGGGNGAAASGQLNNVRISKFKALVYPQLLLEELAPTPKAIATVESSRKEVQSILFGEDDRLLVIVGPCSIHDVSACMDYGKATSACQLLTRGSEWMAGEQPLDAPSPSPIETQNFGITTSSWSIRVSCFFLAVPHNCCSGFAVSLRRFSPQPPICPTPPSRPIGSSV